MSFPIYKILKVSLSGFDHDSLSSEISLCHISTRPDLWLHLPFKSMKFCFAPEEFLSLSKFSFSSYWAQVPRHISSESLMSLGNISTCVPRESHRKKVPQPHYTLSFLTMPADHTVPRGVLCILLDVFSPFFLKYKLGSPPPNAYVLKRSPSMWWNLEVGTLGSNYVWEVHAKALQSCATLCNTMNHNLPASSVHGILQARILESAAMPFARGSSWPGIEPGVYCSSCTGRRGGWVLLPLAPPRKPIIMLRWGHWNGAQWGMIGLVSLWDEEGIKVLFLSLCHVRWRSASQQVRSH